VRVHRDRLVEVLVAVAEVDAQDVADLGLQQRAGDRGRTQRGGEALAPLPVGERAERARGLDRLGHELVEARRRDVPHQALGLDPVLAHLPARLRLGRAELQPVDGRHLPADDLRLGRHPGRARLQRLGLGQVARELVDLGDVLGRADLEGLPCDRADERGAPDPQERPAVDSSRHANGNVQQPRTYVQVFR